MRGATYCGLLALLEATSCLRELSFECDDDGACKIDDRQGQCIAPGHCAYPEADCPSGLRFGPAAGPSLASTCVETGATDTHATATGDCPPCDGVPGPCHAADTTCVDGACVHTPVAEGTPCELDDPCVTAAACDADGVCMVVTTVECTSPPSACHVALGACGDDGSCTYELRGVGALCDDGDGCTLEDRCNVAGTCVPGMLCPTTNACAVGSCSGEQCSFFPVADGTACGLLPGDICCAGACVDVTDDPEHCGACDGVCAPTDVCMPTGRTGACMPG